MAEESHQVRGINWRETFAFTNIFRAFRIAIHPSKLILALVALLSIYVSGRILDMLWPVKHRAVPGLIIEDKPLTTPEISLYEAYSRRPDPAMTFERVRERERKRIEDAYV
jgi:hypothetical protein